MKMRIKASAILLGLLSIVNLSGFSQENQSALPVNSKAKKILFVVTSHDQLGNTGKKTGLWIEEFAAPYFYLTAQGAQITIASPKGGQAPIDPKSNDPEFQTESTRKYFADVATQEKLAHTVLLSKVNQKDYDAVYYPGGHGPMWDLSEDKNSARLIESFIKNQKPVALVCHAPAALKNVKAANGQPLIKGKKVSAFTNTEETAVQLNKVVPFLLEDMLRSKGADYQKGEDWHPFAVQDGLLFTGQNPQSSLLVAQKLMTYLSSSVN
ncbi:type 1 glutamine amidotransferase domain-containing protein [Mucilaginibacter lappiensis]|uniref:type 1 glutamine amidotransferase domain-containing protein n=1 Tax=Mucilaginibacter lappiensis TaxID=354630 RepID=UPI003D196AC0